MPKTKAVSPARSQGGLATPKRKTTRGSRSLCSPALSTASGRLTSLIDQFKDKNMESFILSPLNGRSVLNDNTEIEEPRRKSWWKKLDENSQDVMEVLEDNKLTVNNVIEEFIDIEVLSQEKKNFTLDLPESSDNESINSIVLPQRKLFTQKENQPQKKYGHLIDNRESLAKLHKTTANIDKTVNVGTRELFQNAKRSKPIFPAALLNISPNKTTAEKTRENVLADPKPQVRNIFGNRPTNKRKNMFADFIVSESEDEIPDIQPKIFGFQKKLEQRRVSSVSKGRDASPTSSITTDIEMDFRMLLPSSTMVENQLEDNMLPGSTPVKRARLSKLSEAKESEAGTNTIQSNSTVNKTKQSNKSVTSKNKSKASPDLRDKSLNSSRTTRSMLKNASLHEEIVNISIKFDAKNNKSRSKISSKTNELDVSPSKLDTDKQSVTLNVSQKQNKNKIRGSPKATESEENVNVVNAINNITRVINKSTNKGLLNTTEANKTLVNEKERTIKVDKTGVNDIEQNDVEDDENNFTLEYEDDDQIVEEAVVHNDLDENQKENIKKQNTFALEKDSQETEINKSKSNKSQTMSNKSMQKLQKSSSKTVEESVESQTEQYSADDNVDGHQEQAETILQKNATKEEEMANQKIDNDVNNSREDKKGNVTEENERENEVEVKISHGNKKDVNESKHNEDDLNISQENEDEYNKSLGEIANESHEAENETEEEEEEVNENNDNEEEANQSQDNEAKVSESQEIEEEANNSQDDEEKANDNTNIEKEANECEKVEEEASDSQGIEKEINESEEEANESQEIEKEANESEEYEKANESQEVGEEANESQEIDEDANESQEVDEDANESQEVVEDANESQEATEDANESQEVEEDANESQEAKEDANESQEVEEDANESRIAEENVVHDDEMNEDEEEVANESQDNEASANKSRELENEEESEAEANESEEIEDDQQMDDSDEADKAIASDSEISDDNQAEEMEVDDEEEEQESDNERQQNQHESHEEIQTDEQNEIEPSEEIDESPDVTHDTTGRHRKKHLNKSPEVILHNKSNQMDSFTAKGRNTSVRKTKSMMKSLNIRPSLAPPRDSTGFSDGTRNSSAEGSGWDSHRTTRKTLRQTFGKDFTPRKSLRALVMEKSAKRQTEHTEMHSETVKFPLANSTEMPEDSNHHVEDIVESDHEVSRRTRQTTLELYLQKIKEQNIEKKLKMEAAVRNSLKAPISNSLSLFKVPNKPAPRRPKPAQNKPKTQLKSIIPFDELPSEVIEDMKYKPPKRFQPTNASWITKRLYKFLENKLEPKYDYKARVRAEKLVETIYHFAKDLRRHDVAPSDAVDVLKHELARLDVVRTHFEFYEFFHEFMPREVRIKVVPDIVNKIALPRHGVFSDILRGNTVHG